MADYAPNYTARYKVTYSTLGKTHTTQWRVLASVTDPAPVATKMGLFLGDLHDQLFEDWRVLHAEFALADSDVFLPAPSPAQPAAAQIIPAGAGSDAAVAISFISRSIAAGKGRFFLYGVALEGAIRTAPGQDYRFLSSENTHISDAIVRLNETSPALVCNDNVNAVWYEYVNYKPNDRWVRKLRRG